MAASASVSNVEDVAALDAEKQREASDALFDKLNVISKILRRTQFATAPTPHCVFTLKASKCGN